MNNQKAKFILGAYRPDGRDAGDTTFDEALAQAQRDPDLQAWFEAERKFDTALSAKLKEIAPPAGLREAILAGSGVSAAQRKRRAWRNPLWLVAAAAIIVVAAVRVTLRLSAVLPTGAELAAFALQDVADSHGEHVADPPELAGVQAQLASARLPLTAQIKLDLGELRNSNCRTVRIGGREVFELCFERDGTWYHIYVGRRRDFAPGTIDPGAIIEARGQLASTAWADADRIYALVVQGDADALRRVI